MKTTLQLPEIFNYAKANAEPYKKYIDSIKEFRSYVFEALKERGVTLSGAHALNQEIHTVLENREPCHTFSLVPKNIRRGSREIKFLIKEDGMIKFKLYINSQMPGLSAKWREVNVEIREKYPELQENTCVSLTMESFLKTIDHIATFIKDTQQK